MGCDIHMVVESRKSDYATWDRVTDAVTTCLDCRVLGELTDPYACYWCKGAGKTTTYRWRNYVTFSVLANVRNNVESGVVPISEPRGNPSDSTVSEQDELGDYGYTWVTLDECLRYDWSALCYGTEPLHVRCVQFCTYIEDLRKYADERGITYNNVRLVMGFDS